jgi:HlyD family secretion protein
MSKRINVAIIMVLMLGLTACQANLTVPLLPTPLSGTPLSASGFLEADSVTIASEVGAQIVSIEAEQGQAVSSGQPLVILDDTLAQAQRAQAQAALLAAQASLTQTQAGPRPDAVAAAAADVARAQAVWLGALRAVTDTGALAANPPGLDVQVAQAETQIKLSEQAVQQAKSERDAAQAARDKIPAGYAERDIQEQKLNVALANVEAANVQYDGAVAVLGQLQHMRQFPADLVANWHAAQSQVAVAAGQVAAAQAELAAARAGATPEQVAQAQAEVQIAAANLALIDQQLTHFSVTAPISGVVTSKLALPGEVARAGAPLLVVSDLSQVKLVVYIPVTQMARVAVGRSVTVTVDAYSLGFHGQVSKIASKAEFTPSNVQTKEDRSRLVFAVTISVPNPQLRLKAGMPALAAFGP